MSTTKTTIIGDSHTIAIKDGFAKRGGADLGEVMIDRLQQIKNGVLREGVAESELEEIAAAAQPGDLIVSVLGGNQFNVFGLMRHPEPFDFIEPGDPDEALDPEARAIPVKIMEATFERFVRGRDGKLLKKLAGGKATVLHLEAPPPKDDDAFILSHAETYFKKLDISTVGLSKPALRRKLWRLQSRMTKALCDEIGVVFVPAPDATKDPSGFLKRDYYGRDATHANAAYGVVVLDQIAGHPRGA
ncbi:hypothetical protein [Chenggangzhangella methanolivorans]|uniref:Uncharacterized protein n=1 Tax=Chenggangzhangella methanolivorans TaxID=1437009 RepID=A0A9E6RCF3_9HYPH|nr:hypothetical protein [Chenggangzhangella methanolivorans]QZN98505.1 hypothetical protein K6K41_15770 [Chenggangzhangella methanolivorans]